jgi:hypothetical protein
VEPGNPIPHPEALIRANSSVALSRVKQVEVEAWQSANHQASGRSEFLEHETELAGSCRFAAGALR